MGKDQNLKLPCGRVAIIDSDDFEKVKNIPWYFHKPYVRATIKRGRKTERIYLHRLVKNAPTGLFVDHINRDPLDNRKSNLRICTMSQNCSNRTIQKNSTTKIKGVFMERDGRQKKWRAQIKYQRKTFYLGRFYTKSEAAAAYAEKAKELFKEFANPTPCTS